MPDAAGKFKGTGPLPVIPWHVDRLGAPVQWRITSDYHPPGWSCYTIGNRELERDRRRHRA